jgi:hypothetical protein
MKKMCITCPFNHYSEKAAEVQNYGCLPSHKDILRIKDDTGNNWACHSNNNKICGGLTGERDTSLGKLHIQPGENAPMLSWKEEDLKPILK